MDGYEALIIVDAVDRSGEPGTVYLLETEAPKFAELSEEQQREFLADMHATVPSRVLTLAQALGALPTMILYPRLSTEGIRTRDGLERTGRARRH